MGWYGVRGAIHEGPWTKPLNWNLHTTLDGEVITPFPFYVQPEATSCPSGARFPQFLELPAELQLHVFRFCDAATLFQLMRVSSTIRAEASKLFWSYPDAWYYVESHWLFSGGFAGHAHHAIDFPPYVRQLEVGFDKHYLHQAAADELGVDLDPSYSSLVTPQLIEKHLREFWKTLQRRFPRVTHVTLDQRYTWRKTEEVVLKGLERMVALCPPSINVSVSFLQEAGTQLERRLWRPTKACAGTTNCKWELVSPRWTRQSVLLPLKEFHGPVGLYCSLEATHNSRRAGAVRLLLIEAHARHHFDGCHEPFYCVNQKCGAWFELPGEWIEHALESGHDEGVPPPTELEGRAPPDELMILFQEHQAMVDCVWQEDVTDVWPKLDEFWGKEGSERRLIAEQEFLHQLEHDPLWEQGKPARESAVWGQFTLEMDPTYIYTWRSNYDRYVERSEADSEL